MDKKNNLLNEIKLIRDKLSKFESILSNQIIERDHYKLEDFTDTITKLNYELNNFEFKLEELKYYDKANDVFKIKKLWKHH